MSSAENQIEELAKLLSTHRRIMVFTGAGVSVDSGIPDFRSAGGVWERVDPMVLSRQALMGDERAAEIFWHGMLEIWNAFGSPRPNPIHKAIKTLQGLGRVSGIVTQNIDGLHQSAGSDNVIELHGNQRSCVCLGCARRFPMADVMDLVARGQVPPACTKCGGFVRPEIVLFGDPLPVDEMEKAQSLACTADLCLVLGSSLVVYPAADLPRVARASGAKLAIVTIGETPLDPMAHFRIDGPLNASFTPAVNRLSENEDH
jgi:NAD-dependent deacetylase